MFDWRGVHSCTYKHHVLTVHYYNQPTNQPSQQDGKPLSQDHYWGLFIAGEEVARGKQRVDVKKFKSGNPSGV